MMMQYKGYIGRIEVDPAADVIHGDVLGIRDVVTFQGHTPHEAEQAFHESVDDYLDFCKSRGEQPDKTFSGKFIVRVSPELHRLITISAEQVNMSVNGWINSRLLEAVAQEQSHRPQNLEELGRELRKATRNTDDPDRAIITTKPRTSNLAGYRKSRRGAKSQPA